MALKRKLPRIHTRQFGRQPMLQAGGTTARPARLHTLRNSIFPIITSRIAMLARRPSSKHQSMPNLARALWIHGCRLDAVLKPLVPKCTFMPSGIVQVAPMHFTSGAWSHLVGLCATASLKPSPIASSACILVVLLGVCMWSCPWSCFIYFPVGAYSVSVLLCFPPCLRALRCCS